jgi:hypothetical protein
MHRHRTHIAVLCVDMDKFKFEGAFKATGGVPLSSARKSNHQPSARGSGDPTRVSVSPIDSKSEMICSKSASDIKWLALRRSIETFGQNQHVRLQ